MATPQSLFLHRPRVRLNVLGHGQIPDLFMTLYFSLATWPAVQFNQHTGGTICYLSRSASHSTSRKGRYQTQLRLSQRTAPRSRQAAKLLLTMQTISLGGTLGSQIGLHAYSEGMYNSRARTVKIVKNSSIRLLSAYRQNSKELMHLIKRQFT